jgi:hypothetical protein
VVTARNYATAVAALERQRFDVVVSDYDLGDSRSGLDVLGCVAARLPQARRVLHAARPPRAAITAGAVQLFVEKLAGTARAQGALKRLCPAVKT